MGESILKTKIQQRSDNAANWTAVNPVLAVGEIGYETDSETIKIGNGSSRWNSLAYVGGDGAVPEVTDSAPLGSIAWLAVNDTPDGYEPLWDGHNITRAQYPDFFSRLVDTNKIPTVTTAIFSSQVSTYGSCASFVKIDINTLRLPLLNTYMRAGSTAGGVQNDQIVNIEGTLGSDSGESVFWTIAAQGASGVFALGPNVSTKYANAAGVAGSMSRSVAFDASRVVRTGDQVQPKTFVSRPFLKCADVSRTLTAEQTSEIRNLYSGKANADLGNAVLDKSFSANGYYKAPDGMMLQWGYKAGSTSQPHTVYYPTTFYAAPYFVSGTMSVNGGSAYGITSVSMYASYCQLKALYSGGVASEGFYWFAVGRWK